MQEYFGIKYSAKNGYEDCLSYKNGLQLIQQNYQIGEFLFVILDLLRGEKLKPDLKPIVLQKYFDSKVKPFDLTVPIMNCLISDEDLLKIKALEEFVKAEYDNLNMIKFERFIKETVDKEDYILQLFGDNNSEIRKLTVFDNGDFYTMTEYKQSLFYICVISLYELMNLNFCFGKNHSYRRYVIMGNEEKVLYKTVQQFYERLAKRYKRGSAFNSEISYKEFKAAKNLLFAKLKKENNVSVREQMLRDFINDERWI